MKIFVELFGWYGALALLSAYAFASFGVVAPEGLLFQVLNISGALGIVVVSLYKKAYQPGILNIVWMVVGIVALVKTLTL